MPDSPTPKPPSTPGPQPPPPSAPKPAAKRTFQAPTGLRDLYPADLLRKRYLEKLWRDTSIRHGFEEIDGPTFESTDLYTVKSGEGIVSEIFGVLSGKDEAELAKVRAGGATPYALRPEFTPTLARMYAARAGGLPKPTKWFWMQNCYRAERPQRGRLREFGQWNCDVIGNERSAVSEACADLDIMECVSSALWALGLNETNARLKASHRGLMTGIVESCKPPAVSNDLIFALIDRRNKIPHQEFEKQAAQIGFHLEKFDHDVLAFKIEHVFSRTTGLDFGLGVANPEIEQYGLAFGNQMRTSSLNRWIDFDFSVVRGLAYYTGMVFEVIAEGERAVAGGGRYDNLIELFGGPPTPAVGFGMGDVVLSLLLQDKGLMPTDEEIKDALSRPSASYNPEVFVISAGQSPQDQEEAAAQVRPLVAKLRRGTESPRWLERENRKPWDADRYDSSSQDGGGGVPPMHARHSYKSTKNIGKLLKDAADQRAKLAVILESGAAGTIKDLRTGVQDDRPTPLPDLPAALARRLSWPTRP